MKRERAYDPTLRRPSPSCEPPGRCCGPEHAPGRGASVVNLLAHRPPLLLQLHCRVASAVREHSGQVGVAEKFTAALCCVRVWV